jgi:hypothetical protein
MAPVGAQKAMHQPYLRPGSRRSPQTALALPKRRSVRVMMAGHGRPGEMERQLRRQYSSASMIVITRRVTAGSDGSGEW